MENKVLSTEELRIHLATEAMKAFIMKDKSSINDFSLIYVAKQSIKMADIMISEMDLDEDEPTETETEDLPEYIPGNEYMVGDKFKYEGKTCMVEIDPESPTQPSCDICVFHDTKHCYYGHLFSSDPKYKGILFNCSKFSRIDQNSVFAKVINKK